MNFIIIKHLTYDSEDGYIFEIDLVYPRIPTLATQRLSHSTQTFNN